jgi:L-amino acid N-acyltransferase YncA
VNSTPAERIDAGGARVRPVRAADAAGLRAVYAPVVADTYASFETEVPDLTEMRRRVADVTSRYPWLVAELDGAVAGYAYAARHHDRAAYRWAVDVSVYVAAAAAGRGVGRALYGSLLPQVAGLGYVNAFAGIALPNPASVRLHESFGFRHLGTYEQVGFKAGAWRDVGWWQLRLREPPPVPPADPRAWSPDP